MSPMLRTLAVVSFTSMLVAGSGCAPTEPKAQVAGLDDDGLPVLTEQQKADGIICKREPVTGTRISKKTCSTKAQREANQRAAQEELHRNQRQAVQPSISGG